MIHPVARQLMAFLNNADEPELDLPLPDAASQLQSNLEKAARLLKELPTGDVRRGQAVFNGAKAQCAAVKASLLMARSHSLKPKDIAGLCVRRVSSL